MNGERTRSVSVSGSGAFSDPARIDLHLEVALAASGNSGKHLVELHHHMRLLAPDLPVEAHVRGRPIGILARHHSLDIAARDIELAVAAILALRSLDHLLGGVLRVLCGDAVPG